MKCFHVHVFKLLFIPYNFVGVTGVISCEKKKFFPQKQGFHQLGLFGTVRLLKKSGFSKVCFPYITFENYSKCRILIF